MLYKKILVQTLKLLHLSILIFVILGGFSPNLFLCKIHLILIPLMILQWQLNQGTCILTNIENALEDTSPEKQQQQGQFIKSLLSRCFNPLPSDQTIKIGIYSIILMAWSISAIRVFIIKSSNFV
ncbi:MAG: DUF2784 family protein [Microcoleaceae cyanobacterium]